MDMNMNLDLKFYKNDVPKLNSSVIAEYMSQNDTSVIVRLPEYNNMEAIVPDTSIGKKIKAIRKFIAIMKKGLTVFHVQDICGNEPILVPISDEIEKELVITRYRLSCDIHSLTLDIIHNEIQKMKINSLLLNKCLSQDIYSSLLDFDTNTDLLEHICKVSKNETEIELIKDILEKNEDNIKNIHKKYFKNFLWKINKKLSTLENVEKRTYSYFLENADELLSYSSLLPLEQFEIVNNIKGRLITSSISMSSIIDITVTNKNSISILNQISQMIKDEVDEFHYQDPPHYKILIKKNTIDECKNLYCSLKDKITEFCKKNNWKVIINYDPNNENITENIVKLKPINRYHYKL
jgi:translation initiation factor 2 alpha subunit (eIF-2alpha)